MAQSALDQNPFPASTLADWEAMAKKALRDAPLSSIDARIDGHVLPPLSQPAQGQTPLFRRNRPWRVLQRVDDPDIGRAAKQAAEDIANGAEGLALVFQGAPNAFGHGLPSTRDALNRILGAIDPAKTVIRIDAHPRIRRSADWLIDAVGSGAHGTPKEQALGVDHAAILSGTGRLGMSLDALRASMPQSLSGYLSAGVPGTVMEADGRVYHNAGASAAQELAGMLSAALEHLHMFKNARQPLENGAGLIRFALSMDQRFPLGVAKLRALHVLWRRIQELCSIEAPSAARVHAETSFRMQQVKDFETNILRNTLAVAAAAAGGADTISVLPHTLALGLPDPFARRVARNVQLIARDEAHLGDVSDPAAGSGALEALTDALCETAWKELQIIESEGGILKSLVAGRFQARIRQTVETGDDPVILGVSAFPASKERQASLLDAARIETQFDAVISCDRLRPARLAAQASETGGSA